MARKEQISRWRLEQELLYRHLEASQNLDSCSEVARHVPVFRFDALLVIFYNTWGKLEGKYLLKGDELVQSLAQITRTYCT